MRGVTAGRAVRHGVRAALAAALVLALAACGNGGADPTPVPTFAASSEEGGPVTGSADDGRVVPADCGRILAASDLEALLGLPLGSVAARTTIGIAQPSVGRTERVTCRYSRTGEASRVLLDVNATAYRDAAAASAQWEINVEAESGERREVPLGSAQAVLFEKRGQNVLMVAHSSSNLSLILPEQPLPGDRAPVDVLVDLALRILPAVSIEPSATAPPPAPPAGTVPQAGAAR